MKVAGKEFQGTKKELVDQLIEFRSLTGREQFNLTTLAWGKYFSALKNRREPQQNCLKTGWEPCVFIPRQYFQEVFTVKRWKYRVLMIC